MSDRKRVAAAIIVCSLIKKKTGIKNEKNEEVVGKK